jgi:Zn-dependent protease with chaperone function
MQPNAIPASYLDGRTSRVRPVTLYVVEGRVVVTGDGIARDEPLGAIEIPHALGRTARQLRFVDGAACVVTDLSALAGQLRAAGIEDGFVTRWEESWPRVVASLVLLVVMLVGVYWLGAPYAARRLASQIPAPLAEQLSVQVLELFDGRFFEESQMSEGRRAAIRMSFHRLQFPAERPDMNLRVEFRASAIIGPNALALPSGQIIVTDELEALAEDDWELLGVLAHEAGHVYHHHGLRQLLQSSAIGLIVSWFVGDVSVVVAMVPTALLQARYSRDFEREADDFAAAALAATGIPVEHFLALLERLEAQRGVPSAGRSVFRYLESHPATAERLDRLRTSER